ncbi:hypothetical protein GYMLUDRAFT_60882 [Collybiopsis luxurians FD-317 M1]|uniref:t-SNARE coiled-coil homology domain-containing protein n=1 Tax=Collybiopsis luxurians FD-317 M1 TaxID=944289 RepID=A0A0D0B420_9AGAR|nr:hypothetical protein GYMLUDRAFT_60882 [Collybiopsis luxurians FD-317 M1]
MSRISTPLSNSRTGTPTPGSQTPSQALAKLTSISTKTLSLLLERQRGSTLSTASSTIGASNTLHLEQIQDNLKALRSGILDLESRGGNSQSQAQTEAVKLLRKQYERMRGMLLAEGGVDVPSLDVPVPKNPDWQSLTSPSNASLAPLVGTPPSHSRSTSTSPPADYNGPFTPYTDEPRDGPYEDADPRELLQTQQQLLNTQDTHLSALSDSISRHHALSLQINTELDTHHGLLEELDTELDRTEGRLGRARRRLDRVSRGLRGNGSTVCIGVLILVLLILIIAFKT